MLTTRKTRAQINNTNAAIPVVPIVPIVPALNTNVLPTNANANQVSASASASAIQTTTTNANHNNEALVSIPKVPYVSNWTKTEDQLKSLIEWLQQVSANSSLPEPELSKLMSNSAAAMLNQMIRFVDKKIVDNYLSSKGKQKWEDLERKIYSNFF